MDSSVSLKDQIWFLCMCHHVRNVLYLVADTFADDTAILTVHEDSTMAAHRLKMHLNKIQSWLETWRMKGNEAKSVQVTYTLNKMIIYPKRTR